MAWDWTIKLTDVLTIIALVAGPIIAVRITEKLRIEKDSRDRKVHILEHLWPLARLRLQQCILKL